MGTSDSLKLDVTFGGVSIGDETARVGVKFSREAIDLDKADEVFCGHRLTGKLVLGKRDDSPGQTKMFDGDIVVSGVFDCKRLAINALQFSTGLTFSLKDIDVAEFARLSKGAGTLHIENVAAIPTGDDDEADLRDDVEVDGLFDDKPHTLETNLDDVFAGALRTSLHEAGIDTIGQLFDYRDSGKALTDVAGIGESKAVTVNKWIDQARKKLRG